MGAVGNGGAAVPAVGDWVWIDLFGRGPYRAQVQRVCPSEVDPYVIVSCNGFSGVLKTFADVYTAEEEVPRGASG